MNKNTKSQIVISGSIRKAIASIGKEAKRLHTAIEKTVADTYKVFCGRNGLNPKDIKSGNLYRKYIVPIWSSETGYTEKYIRNIIAQIKALPCGRPQSRKARTVKVTTTRKGSGTEVKTSALKTRVYKSGKVVKVQIDCTLEELPERLLKLCLNTDSGAKIVRAMRDVLTCESVKSLKIA